jgi:hypothetical protein
MFERILAVSVFVALGSYSIACKKKTQEDVELPQTYEELRVAAIDFTHEAKPHSLAVGSSGLITLDDQPFGRVTSDEEMKDSLNHGWGRNYFDARGDSTGKLDVYGRARLGGVTESHSYVQIDAKGTVSVEIPIMERVHPDQDTEILAYVTKDGRVAGALADDTAIYIKGPPEMHRTMMFVFFVYLWPTWAVELAKDPENIIEPTRLIPGLLD